MTFYLTIMTHRNCDFCHNCQIVKITTQNWLVTVWFFFFSYLGLSISKLSPTFDLGSGIFLGEEHEPLFRFFFLSGEFYFLGPNTYLSGEKAFKRSFTIIQSNIHS